jgi:hypothetical protein
MISLNDTWLYWPEKMNLFKTTNMQQELLLENFRMLGVT